MEQSAALHCINLTFIPGDSYSFIQAISIAPIKVRYYPESLPTQHGYCAEVSRRSGTGRCELRTWPKSLKSFDSTNAPPRPTLCIMLGAVHKVRHARGGQEHVTIRLYKFLSYIIMKHEM